MPQRAAISAGAVVLREIDGVLCIALAQHQRRERPWVLPKGHVEPGETLEEAALREVHEEAGLVNVQLIKHLGTVTRRASKGDNEKPAKTIHYYLAYALRSNKSVQPTDRAFAKVGWFPPQVAIELLPYEDDRAFLRVHLAHLFS